MKLEFGTLSKVDARAVLGSEKDSKEAFTKWLAEHLEALGATLGMDLELIHQNGAVGGFAVDIIARDTGRDRAVIIENQLDSSNDSHLGQLISLAGGQDARVVVWISPEFRDSHRQALEWLNRLSGRSAEFYALAFDLFRIDDSKPAVEFRLMSAPDGHLSAIHPGANGTSNGHGASVTNAVSNGNGTAAAYTPNGRNQADADQQEAYRKFFQRLVDELREKYHFTNAKLGQPQNWYSFASGVSGVVYSIWFSGNGRVRAELYIDVGNRDLNRTIFDRLRQSASDIEREFADKLEWDASESRRACSVGTYLSGRIDDAPEAVETVLKWTIDRMVRFKKVFGPRLPGIARTLQQEAR
jgi:uncharacterized protein DUF4268